MSLGPKPANREDSYYHGTTSWASHDITHLHQIARVMAHQVRGGVGPFSRNLGVMRCSAHGDGPGGPESK
jgi:hypothetical protein